MVALVKLCLMFLLNAFAYLISVSSNLAVARRSVAESMQNVGSIGKRSANAQRAKCPGTFGNKTVLALTLSGSGRASDKHSQRLVWHQL